MNVILVMIFFVLKKGRKISFRCIYTDTDTHTERNQKRISRKTDNQSILQTNETPTNVLTLVYISISYMHCHSNIIKQLITISSLMKETCKLVIEQRICDVVELSFNFVFVFVNSILLCAATLLILSSS